jgi:hypothetical protein
MRSLVTLFAIVIPSTALAQPVYQPRAAASYRSGLTFEANLGLGAVWLDRNSDGASSDTLGAVAGLNLGIGGFVTPQLAITLRAAGVTYSEDMGPDSASFVTGFLGPTAQYWFNDNVWAGGGLGLGFASLLLGDIEYASEAGLGIVLRGGYTLSPTSKSSWNISAELTSAMLEQVDANGFGLLAGYQWL